MTNSKYKNYFIKPSAIENLLVESIDGYAQTFEVFEDNKSFYIRLGITNITRKQTYNSKDKLSSLFLGGVKKVIDLFISDEEQIRDWNYFIYDQSGEWIRSSKKF